MMRANTLTPSLFTVVILGLTPVGPLLVSTTQHLLDIPEAIAAFGLYGLVLLVGTLAMPLLGLIFAEDDPTAVDSVYGIDDRNGQQFFSVLLAVTLLLGVLAIAGDLQRSVNLGCVLGASIVGIAPEWLFFRIRRPSRLKPADAHPVDDVTASDSADAYRLSYSWAFTPSLDHARGSAHYTIRLDIPKSVVRHFSEREHPMPTADSDLTAVLPQYVTNGLTDEVVLCAGRVATEGRRQDLPFLDFIDFVLTFVRDAIEYKSDQELHGEAEYFAYPIETLVHKKGDCDCHAILAAALLTSLGIDTILIDVPGHLAIGIAIPTDRPGHWVQHGGRRYYYGEATPQGEWRLGEVPEQYRNKLVPIPIDMSDQ